MANSHTLTELDPSIELVTDTVAADDTVVNTTGAGIVLTFAVLTEVGARDIIAPISGADLDVINPGETYTIVADDIPASTDGGLYMRKTRGAGSTSTVPSITTTTAAIT